MSKPFVPHPYQTMIRDHILDLPRAGVWAGMGMGKTSSTLTAIEALQYSCDGPTLVMAPLRVANSTWPEEAKKWDQTKHLRVQPITGSKVERMRALHKKADVYTINYDNIPWLVEELGDRWPYRTVVSDESTRLKNFRLRQGGKRTQALSKVAHTKVDRFVQLTGTPAPNGLADLWGQAWFLDRGERLGRTYDSFRQRWFQKSFDGYSVDPLAHAQREIQDRLRDLYITIDAKDWFELEEPIVRNIYIDLPVRARQHYRDMEREMFTALDSGDNLEAFGSMAKTLKCLQMCSGATYVGENNESWVELHDLKLQALDSIVSEANGMPVLVAYHFKSDLARMKAAFPKGRHLDSNPQTVKDWNDGKIPLLFAHPQSAGHGLNLQDGGNILVYFSHWWNMEERDQILERIGPMRQKQAGHNRNVWIYNLIARDTVDEDVIECVETKRGVQSILLDAMKRRRNN